MPPHLSQKRFAALVGCSQPTVSKALRAGRLVDDGQGIDIEHPANIFFAEEQRCRRASKGLAASPWSRGERTPVVDPNPGQASPRESRRGAEPAPAPAAPRAAAGNNIVAETKRVELELKRARLERERIKLRKASRRLVSTSMVKRSIAHLNVVLEDHFRSFGERNAASVVAVVLGGGREGVIADLLDAEVSKAVTAFKRAVAREIETLQGDPDGK